MYIKRNGSVHEHNKSVLEHWIEMIMELNLFFNVLIWKTRIENQRIHEIYQQPVFKPGKLSGFISKAYDIISSDYWVLI